MNLHDHEQSHSDERPVLSEAERQIFLQIMTEVDQQEAEDPLKNLGEGTYGRPARIEKFLKQNVGKLSQIQADALLMKEAERANPSYWRSGVFGVVKDEVAVAQQKLIAAQWSMSRRLQGPKDDVYVRVGMVESKNDDKTDIKIHLTPPLEKMGNVAVLLALATEVLKKEKISIGYKISYKKRTDRSDESIENNPPRVVVYLFGSQTEPQRTAELKRVWEVVRELVDLAQIPKDPDYSPRYTLPASEDSPIGFVQGLGHEKNINPKYKERFSPQGGYLFTPEGAEVIASILKK
jgi:hypothetical protein